MKKIRSLTAAMARAATAAAAGLAGFAAIPAMSPAVPALAIPAIYAANAAPAAAQEDMLPEDRARLRAEIRRYLLENPEVIMEAIQVLEQRRKQAGAAAEQRVLAGVRDALRDDGYSYVAGNPDGDVTVVEFTDYNCGYCKRAHKNVKALIASDPGVRLVVKEFPILGPTSRIAAEAALAAMGQQDGALYLAFNDAMMTHRGRLDETVIYSLAAKVGLDVDKLRSDAGSERIKANIETTYGMADKLSITGTPTFIIGERIVRGFIPLADMREAIAEQRDANG